MPTYFAKDITTEFEDLERGTLLYSPVFEGEDEYNCSLKKVVPGKSITVVHNGVSYTFNSRGNFGDMNGRNIFLNRKSCKRR